MLYEFYALFKQSDYAPNAVFNTVLGLLLYGLGIVVVRRMYEPDSLTYLGIALFILFTLMIWMGAVELTRPTKKPFMNAVLGMAGIMYIVPSMVFINFISSLGPEKSNTFPLLGIFIMVWCYDTFAYLIGKQFGKHKMAQKISPNKSWEGFIGGVVFAVIAGVILSFFRDDQPTVAYIILGLIAGGFGMLGDLFESLIKRQVDVKDSGNIMPGHGGLLDRFDSILFVMPISFFIIILIMFYLS